MDFKAILLPTEKKIRNDEKNKRTYIIALVVFCVAISILQIHYWSNDPPTNINLDLGFPLQFMSSKQSLLDAISTQQWDHLGNQLFILDSNFTELIPKFIHLIVPSTTTVIKIVQILQLLIAYGCTFLLLQKLKLKNIASIIGALAYITTPFVMQMLNGGSALIWAYSFFPLAVLGIIIATEKLQWQWSIIAGITIALATTLSMIQFIYFSGFALGIIGTGLLFAKWKTSRQFMKIVKHSLLVVLTATTISAFILLPTIFENGPYRRYEADTTYRETPYVKNFYSPTFQEILSLQNKEWIQSEEIGVPLQNLPRKDQALPLIILCLSVTGYAVSWKTKARLPLQLVALAGIISAYFALPFYDGESHQWLSKILPGFFSIRTPGRFLVPLMLTVATGIALFINQLSNGKYRMIRWSGVTIIAIILCATAYGTSSAYHTFETQPIEKLYPDLEQVTNFLNAHDPNHEYRIADLTLSNTGGSLHHTKYYTLGRPTLHNIYELYWRFGDTEEFANMLAYLNVRYIITNPDPPSSEALPLQNREKNLDQNKRVKKVMSTPNNVTVWEIAGAQPEKFKAKEIGYIGDLQGYRKLLLALQNDGPIAITPLNHTNPQQATVIGISDYKETLALEHFKNEIKTLAEHSIYGLGVTKRGNIDINESHLVNTIFNNDTTRNTIHSSRIYADTALETTEKTVVRIPTTIWRPTTLLIRFYSEDGKVIIRHGKTISVLHQKNKNQAEWHTLELDLDTTKIEIEITGGYTVLDSYAMVPTKEWKEAYNSTATELENLNTTFYIIAETENAIDPPRKTSGQQTLNETLTSEAANTTVNTRQLATPDTPNDQHIYFFTTRDGFMYHYSYARKIGITLSLSTLTLFLYTILSLWKKRRSP